MPMDVHTELARFNPDPALQAWVTDTLQRLLDQADQDAETIRNANLKIQALTLELAHHRRIRFGQKSEAGTPEQRELFQEAWNEDGAALEAEIEQQAPIAGRRKRTGAGRQPLPEHLPRIEHRHEPDSCTCGQCGQGLIKIGEDVAEQLDVEPARFFVHRHIRPQYACRQCETITAAVVPPAVIDGGLATPGLLAWVVTSKYLDHLPLYRLERMAARQEVPLSRSTLAEWVGRTGVALQPLADRLADWLRQRQVLHADETPVAQLDPGQGKTKRAYLWTYRSNDLETGPPIVVFDYRESRSGSHAREFLSGWRGHLMVDDYSGYKALFGPDVVLLACLAHARRKFYELHAANPSPLVTEALHRIGELYAIEEQGRALDVPARKALRWGEAIPKLEALHAWLIHHRQSVADGSGTARAMDYSLKRWPALSRYATAGDLPIDNNPVENAIRPIAIGRKNWLFTGSARAGRRAAAIQSLLATARLNGLDPVVWLKDALEKLPSWPHSRLDELLPIKGG